MNSPSTYAIGDIHGNADLLRRLLANLALHPADTIVFLGDFIDRGDDSRGVIDTIIELRETTSANVVTLLGNHEDWLLRTMNDYTSHSWLLSMGATASVESYSTAAAQTLQRELTELGPRLFTERCELPYHLFFDAMPTSHKAFFRDLETSFENEHAFFCHAGINPSLPLREQCRQTLVWGETLRFETYAGKPVVYGHWGNADTADDGATQPHQIGNTFGIDASGHNSLIALKLPEQSSLSVGCG